MHHHHLSVLSALSTVLFADLAVAPAPLWGDVRAKHTWSSVPASWESLGPPPDDTTIDLHIALKPHRENALIDALYEVSSPGHQKYGAHLSKEQVSKLVAPHQDTLEIVHSWLGHHGVPSSSISTSHGGGWLTITGVPVSQADELLCADYQLYRRTGTDETEVILRTVGYALPAVLHAHVETVAPTTHFASPRTPLQIPRARSGGDEELMANATSEELERRRNDVVTPSLLRWLYKTQSYVPSAMDQNMLGILGLNDEYPNRADLTQFMNTFRADAAAATFTVVQVNGGGDDSSKPGVEASLNIQYAEAMAYPTPHIFYSTGGSGQWMTNTGRPTPGDPYLEWLRYLLSRKNIARTISISYGIDEHLIPQEYARVLCKMFARLGLLGVSVLVASGDDGVGPKNCKDSSGEVRFMPTFPSSCPWVTSVGGTTGKEPEVAASISGGGFSVHFPRPEYQDRTMFTYLEFLGIDYVGLYQPEGRGIPDISAQAIRFLYVRNSKRRVVSGTSGSAPTVAGIVTLLNDYLLSTGRDPLGFLNPLLYGRGLAALNDIRLGSNPGCGTPGFLATAGWDPVTGLGTLDFQKLQRILDSFKTITKTITPTVTGSSPAQHTPR